MSRKSFYIVGYFGAPNLGDELLCRSVVERLRRTYSDSTICVVSQSAEVSKKYTGIEAEYIVGCWPDAEYYRSFGRHIRAVTKSSLVVIGGGGLISDHYSWAGIPQYCIEALLAILIGRPYVFVGLGVKEVRRRCLRKLASFVCRYAVVIYCRDQDSSEQLQKLTGRRDIRVAPDLANMECRDLWSEWEEKDYTLVNVRERPHIDENKLTEFCRKILESTRKLVLLVAEKPDANYYRKVVENWTADEQTATKIVNPSTLNEAIRWIGEAKFVAAERMHANLIAVHCGKRLMTINYESKVEQFFHMLNSDGLMCRLEDIGAGSACALLKLDSPEISAKLHELEENATKEFDSVIKAGLSFCSYKFWQRFFAGLYFIILLAFGVVFSLAVLVKRVVFSRGFLRCT